ncbi:MAG: hypothetical protein WC656_01255 [Sulfurimonas sp.]
MPTINNASLHTSFLKQFNNKNISISSDLLKHAIDKSFTGNEIRYEDIKKSNGVLHSLIKDEVAIKRTQLLSMIAVALGYENHHALKSEYERTSNKFKLNLSHITDDMHPLKKLYIIKDEMYKVLKEHDILSTSFNLSNSKREIHLLLNLEPNETYVRSSKQRVINEFFGKYNLKTYKNIVVIPWKYSSYDITTAINIITHFGAFFYPNMVIENNSAIESAIGKKMMVSFSHIHGFRNSIIVNDAMSDNPHHTVLAALEYSFNSKNPANIDAFIEIITNTYKKTDLIKSTNMADFSELTEFIETKRKDGIRSHVVANIIDKYKREISIFEPTPDAIPYIKEMEKHIGLNIGSYMKSIVLELIGSNGEQTVKHTDNKFPFDELLEKMSKSLTDHTHDETDNNDSNKSYSVHQALKNIIYDIEKDVEFLTEMILQIKKDTLSSLYFYKTIQHHIDKIIELNNAIPRTKKVPGMITITPLSKISSKEPAERKVLKKYINSLNNESYVAIEALYILGRSGWDRSYYETEKYYQYVEECQSNGVKPSQDEVDKLFLKNDEKLNQWSYTINHSRTNTTYHDGSYNHDYLSSKMNLAISLVKGLNLLNEVR